MRAISTSVISGLQHLLKDLAEEVPLVPGDVAERCKRAVQLDPKFGLALNVVVDHHLSAPANPPRVQTRLLRRKTRSRCCRRHRRRRRTRCVRNASPQK
jgi:hypothetical protein